MYDIIIIGAGTAGLTAAIYGVRAGKSVLVFEGESYGGQIIYTPEVENYPGIKNISGYMFANNLYEQASSLGGEFSFEKVIKIEEKNDIKIVYTEDSSFECKTIIIATGAKYRNLGVLNEEKFIGSGISYCATCDGAFYRDKNVAVIGGGNTALEDALFLSNFCTKVYLVHRRDQFRGEQAIVDKLKTKDNVEFVFDSVVTDLIGDEFISGITIKNLKKEENSNLIVDGIFVAVGQLPQNQIFKQLIELDASEYIIAGEDCKTNIKGIFTAGDCRTKTLRQLTTAASDGAIAATSACEYIG